MTYKEAQQTVASVETWIMQNPHEVDSLHKDKFISNLVPAFQILFPQQCPHTKAESFIEFTVRAAQNYYEFID